MLEGQGIQKNLNRHTRLPVFLKSRFITVIRTLGWRSQAAIINQFLAFS